MRKCGYFLTLLDNGLRFFIAVLCILFSFSLFFSDVVFAQRAGARPRAGATRMVRKAAPSTAATRAGTVVNENTATTAVVATTTQQTDAEKAAAEEALNTAKSMRDVYNKKLLDLQAQYAEAQADVKKGVDLKCNFEGTTLTVAQMQARVNTEQAFVDTNKDYKNALDDLEKKQKEKLDLETSISEKETKLESMLGGTVALGATGLAGTGALVVSGIDFFKTLKSKKDLEGGGQVCEKYGIIGR
jgi:hypothetical protein